MGCASSTAVEAREARHEARLHDMMGDMMQQAQQMQQESIARQQQMARDDPECQVILDKHLELQKRGISAIQSGNQAEIHKVQLENAELAKHPKYLKMMMPVTISNTKSFSGKSGSRGKTAHATKITSMDIGGNANPDMNQTIFNMFQQANQNPAGNAGMFHSTTNNPTLHNFGTPATPGGGGGFDFGSGGGCNDFGSSGGNNFGSSGGNDFGSSGGGCNDFGSSGGNDFGSSGCNDFSSSY